MWRGPHRKTLRPEDRRYTLIIKNSFENQYLRQKAVRCLADHEIGTHFVSFHRIGHICKCRLFCGANWNNVAAVYDVEDVDVCVAL